MSNARPATRPDMPRFMLIRVMLSGLLLFLLLSAFFGFFFVFSEAIKEELRGDQVLPLDLGGAGRHSFFDLAILAVCAGMAGAALYHAPLFRWFAAKARGLEPRREDAGLARKRIFKSPAVTAFAVPVLLVPLMSARLVSGRATGEGLGFMLALELAVLALCTMFIFLWQRHRVQSVYLPRLFSTDELARSIPGAHRTRIRANFFLMVALSTLLPILVVALFIGTGISWAGKASDLGSEQHRLLFGSDRLDGSTLGPIGSLPAMAHRNIMIQGLPVPFVAPLDVFRIVAGLALGLSLIVVYVWFIARWTASDIIDPVMLLRRNVDRAKEGDLGALTPAVTANEIGELTVGFNEMLRGIAERERIKSLFGQYLTKEISEAIIDGRVKLDGARYEATVVFSDIRGFTSMSERMRPEEVFAFLNDYLGRMIEVIAARGGIIDKFLGDGILSVFGLPVPSEHHASEAFAAALDMRSKLAEMNEERAGQGLEPVRIGIGMHTGEVIAGNVGNARKLQYTIIGDTVNLASRIEGLNKTYGTDLLMSGATRARLTKDEGARLELIEAAIVRGKSDRVDIWSFADS
jgi:class 3 adenylate cyclase